MNAVYVVKMLAPGYESVLGYASTEARARKMIEMADDGSGVLRYDYFKEPIDAVMLGDTLVPVTD